MKIIEFIIIVKIIAYMSGYDGDEGYMILSPEVEDEEHANNYYTRRYYQSDANDPNTIDKSRHVNGHSKVLVCLLMDILSMDHWIRH